MIHRLILITFIILTLWAWWATWNRPIVFDAMLGDHVVSIDDGVIVAIGPINRSFPVTDYDNRSLARFLRANGRLFSTIEQGRGVGPYRNTMTGFALKVELLFAPIMTAFIAALTVSLHRRRKQLRIRHRLINGLCLNCGYNLHGTTAPQCPECGQSATPHLNQPQSEPRA